ncbi:class 1 fructose-bisphosphatase [Candidatus Methylacidiphilum infernorum]|uniref:Fructose-1,6-bisphosphatase class 1 n=1 Tax=Methylacidiphilum infernorum (isolate V4) TaxID=481448 RepID=F16PA_METI4|nr:class 1 fructose-bisphosphatase [Candidatus Methylacidiphilum infernorum]B3DWS5.1 RecName: Full=Fructose-1,6-bisphosphatase class 1; Short=FBPase class 1; AltName: Full=D-fructose-1,6-bisphosphate 1-phosphohydrolase class 1 [Methylacidiphilum infernorum V4]ACD83738.1 Fructose-1,6-bisphosphatase [Methylacidiphilum infernorum V4]
MSYHRMTLSKFLLEQRKKGVIDPDLGSLINDIESACKYVAAAVSKGKLISQEVNVTINVQGEEQKPLDVIANEIFLKICEQGDQLQGMVSEEMESPYIIPPEHRRGKYLLIYDPLDGSSNLDVNLTVGSIFSVLKAPESGEPLEEKHFLRPGREQLAAGFTLYGPSVMFILTLGNGVHGFTLDREVGIFTLTHPDMRITPSTKEFAINASNERFWEPPVRRYVEECIKGKTGPRGKDFNMRWIASMVAEVYRILIRGGLFMYPRDTKDLSKPGRLRLLYEANPMGFIVEQAGGMISTGRESILDIVPRSLHQRIAVILGSKEEVELLNRYHNDYDSGKQEEFESPLFSTRSLFRNP